MKFVSVNKAQLNWKKFLEYSPITRQYLTGLTSVEARVNFRNWIDKFFEWYTLYMQAIHLVNSQKMFCKHKCFVFIYHHDAAKS